MDFFDEISPIGRNVVESLPELFQCAILPHLTELSNAVAFDAYLCWKTRMFGIPVRKG